MDNPKPQRNDKPPGTQPSDDRLRKIGEAIDPLQKLCRDAKDPEALKLYASLLIDMEPENLQLAVSRYLSEATELWFPAPGLLRKYASQYRSGELPDWHHAWDRIMEASCMFSQNDKKLAERAHEMLGCERQEGELVHSRLCRIVWRHLGGFIRLGSADGREMSVLQSNFRNAFTTERTRAARDRALPQGLIPYKDNPKISAEKRDAQIRAIATYEPKGNRKP